VGDASRLAALVARLRPDESGHYKRFVKVHPTGKCYEV
jgi:hypothetical protein